MNTSRVAGSLAPAQENSLSAVCARLQGLPDCSATQRQRARPNSEHATGPPESQSSGGLRVPPSWPHAPPLTRCRLATPSRRSCRESGRNPAASAGRRWNACRASQPIDGHLWRAETAVPVAPSPLAPLAHDPFGGRPSRIASTGTPPQRSSAPGKSPIKDSRRKVGGAIEGSDKPK